MTKSRNKNASAAEAEPIRLPADIGIEQAMALQAGLAPRLAQAEPVRIEASEVQRIHGAALQLLCLFCRDRRANGGAVEFLRPSEFLRQAAALLGASTLLQISLTES
ncbi:MAG: hypothetical protein JWQ90_5527 [Hydrocarboniphaga sp.]|uniref:STAS domain-containing protein n=1 Tax=Hydrocarboniphaga sp. TaxID=2033016 RepID=UPI00260BD437|nr:STAS domain-containing protein [Hydrocarboniphaga sp.]MDB5973077.1 hypothetical protein [Hydrocarboniphaga sp.]